MLGPSDYHHVSGLSLHRRSLYRGFSHTFYYSFGWDIEFSSLCREYRYIEDRYIGVPLYLFISFYFLSFHCITNQFI